MKLALLTPALGSANSGDALIESAIRRLVPADEFLRLPIRRPLTAAEMTDLNACDAALICGSNLYQERRQCALNEAFLSRLRVPLIPLGVGASAAPGRLPVLSTADEALVRALHSRAPATSVRDPATLRLLHNLGVSNARLTGCPVLFHALLAPDIQPGTGKVTVSLRRTFLHGAESLENRQEPLLEALCAAHRPLLLCQSAADLELARRLARRFKLDWAHDFEHGCDIHEWLASRQAWTGGFRLHHGMLALSHGRPAWFVAHDSRVDEFCRMMELPVLAVRTATTEEVLQWGPERLGDFQGFRARWEQLAAEMAAVLKENGLPCALGEPPPRQPKLLFVVPRREWAYDFSARSLQQRTRARFDIRLCYATDQPLLRPEPYDLSVVFFWAEQAHRARGMDPNRVVKYVSSHRWQFPGKYGRLTAPAFAGRYLEDAATVFTTSQRLLALLREVFPRARLASNGFEPAVFYRMADREGGLKVGAAGRASDAVKGFQDVLAPVVAGHDFTLADGSLAHEAMNAFYNRLDVLVITSEHEGEPLTLIEAMAAGCFPVCTDVGIVPELVEHGRDGFIVKERSVEAFRQALDWCAAHLDEVRAAGRRNAERLLALRSWEVVLPATVAHLEEALHFADTAWFLAPAPPSPQAAARLEGLLAWYRQRLEVAGTRPGDAEALGLAEAVRRAWEQGRLWRLQPGARYWLDWHNGAPADLGWEGLERALSQALLPQPETGGSLLSRLRKRWRRWRDERAS